MASSFPPPLDGPDDLRRAGRQSPSRSTRRPFLGGILSRLIMLAVTLLILSGIIALVRTGNPVAPSSNAASAAAPLPSVASSSPGTQRTGTQTPTNPAPDFTLATLGGGSFHLANRQGHVVILYFMATGCADCTPGSHDLGQALTKATIPGAEAVGIDVNGLDQPADLEALVQGAGIPASATIHWGIDTTGLIAHLYGVQILETTVVIDPHGHIAYRSNGAIPPDQLVEIVRNLT